MVVAMYTALQILHNVMHRATYTPPALRMFADKMASMCHVYILTFVEYTAPKTTPFPRPL